MRTPIAINGACGRMGQRLVALAHEDPHLHLVAAVDSPSNPRIGEDAGVVAGVGPIGVPVTGVSIDSRRLAIGEAFFAIRAARDGHDFLRDAAAHGAACLVVHTLPDDLPPSVPTVLVDDTTRALGRLAAYHRARFDVRWDGRTDVGAPSPPGVYLVRVDFGGASETRKVVRLR